MKFFQVIFLISLLTACGKYAPPYAPEDLSPQAVRELNVTTASEGVNFEWKSPLDDQLGKELRSLDGYLIYRKAVEREGDLLSSDVEFEEIARLEDQSVIERDKLRDEARLENKPTRRIKPSEDLQKFAWLDSSVEAGKVYAYRVVPINQDGVEGLSDKIIRVAFRGENSEVTMIPYSNFDERQF